MPPRRRLFAARFKLAIALLACLLILASAGPSIPEKNMRKSFSAEAATQSNASVVGQWGPTVFTLPGVPVHISLLPDTRLLYWGRDKSASGFDVADSSQTYIWDRRPNTPPDKVHVTKTNFTTNLFCSGHSFLPDGRLLVTGGHEVSGNYPEVEGLGSEDINVFDYRTDTWAKVATMNKGRWYPTNVTLENGETAILSGSYWSNKETNPGARPVSLNNTVPEIYTAQGTLRQYPGSAQAPNPTLEYYPFLHLAPDGRIFIAGPQMISYFFDRNGANGNGSFVTLSQDAFNTLPHDFRTGSSVLYDAPAGKVMVVGGEEPFARRVLTETALIDLPNLNPPDPTQDPRWRWSESTTQPVTKPLNIPRRYHTATILPDGKVLVTSGTRCPPTDAAANTIDCGGPASTLGAVQTPELWNPATETWTLMATSPHGIPRAYHSVGLLLPDATVLVGGGGLPAALGEAVGNRKLYGHNDAEIFYPPYLFNSDGTRAQQPAISSVPSRVNYGQSFIVGTANPDSIGSVVLIRLPSVTHGFNQDQRRVVLSYTSNHSNGLNVTSPATGRLCPPGHYMMFLLNQTGTPSEAKIIQVGASQQTVTASDVGGRVAVNSDGRMQVFYRSAADSSLHYITQAAQGSESWSAPAGLGGVITSNPVAIANADGRIDVIGRGSDNMIWHRTQNSPGSSTWSEWAQIYPGTNVTSELSVVRGADGRLQVFYRGGDNALYYATQSAANSSTWSPPASLGGVITSEPSAAVNADGRIEVFVRGTDNGLHRNWQTVAGNNASWSGWSAMGGGLLSPPVALRGGDGILRVYVRGSDNGIWFASQASPGSSAWNPYDNLGGPMVDTPAAAVNSDGRLEVFARWWGDYSLRHRWQLSPNGSWSAWSSQGGILTSSPSALRDGSGRLHIFVRGTDNAIYYTSQSSASSTTWTGFRRVGGGAGGF
jgi:Galactose oxidase-like, Early set domain/Glyoxal oxidase N-terminus